MTGLPIGRAIRDYRQHRKLSIEELSARVQCDQSGLSKIELDIHSPKVEKLDRIAEALGIPVYKLVKYAYRLRVAEKLSTTPATEQETAHGR